jgi:hypothetical protein
MRRVLGFLAAIGLVAAISPATVAAAAPVRAEVSMTGIRCDGLATEAGLASVYVEVVGEGSFVSLVLISSGDPEAVPDIMTDFGSATFDGSRLSATFYLVFVEESEDPEEPPIFTPAGSAQVEAILRPDGDLEDFSWDPERIGNVWERQGLFSQLLSVEGTLSIDLLNGAEATTELTGCGAGTLIQTLFATNPNAFVVSGDQLFMECRWTTVGGSVELRALTDEFGTDFSELIVLDGARVLVGLTSPDFGEAAYGATYEVFEPATKGEIVGSATADAALTPSGDRVDDKEWVEGTRFSLIGDVLTVDGSLSISVDGATTVLSMDDAACDATDLRVRVIEKIPQG